MARQNDYHTPKTLRKLIDDFDEALGRVKAGTERVEKNRISEPISLSHGSALQKGMLALRNFARELDAKVDKHLDIYSVKGIKMK